MDRLVESAQQEPRRVAWLPEFLWLGQQRILKQVRLLGLAILVGIVAGLGAIVFYAATRTVEHYALGVVAGYDAQPRPAGETSSRWMPPIRHPLYPWLLLIVPTVGGLLSGALVFTMAPEAEGHGTDAVINAYHHRQGQIRPRVPLVKIVASSLTLGSGGSGGREGPIAQIGAGFGSLLANLLRLKTADRRVLMAAGMGAGIAAIFRAPLAGALFAAEVLYSSPEFEADVIIPAAIASVISYCTFGIYAGWKPLFAIPEGLSFSNPWELGPYFLLVLFSILLASIYTRTFYGCVGLFHRLPLRRHFRPALGAFLTGAVALCLYFLVGGQQQVLAVLSFGYSAIQGAMTQETAVSAWVLLAIALGKILTTALTIGSGGSGGVFGPSMVIGGCGGGALGLVLHNLWPTLVPHPATFVIIGMAGFFAAAAKTPFSTLVIVSEMTGGYRLLLPALWVCALSYVLSDKRSIYSSQVESRSRSPAHQGNYVREVLAGEQVAQFLDKKPPSDVLHPDDPLGRVISLMADAPYANLPVVDHDRRLLGIVDLEEMQSVLQAPHVHNLVLTEDLMRSDIRPLRPHDTLDRALELFVENDLLILPVVDDLEKRKLIGMVRRSDISNAYIRRIQGPAAEVST
ncbi:MAG: chloride channel protein [Planctomycetaceae bacterium]|nr:chloride channel protein [Planctomycetaceae bacterium]